MRVYIWDSKLSRLAHLILFKEFLLNIVTPTTILHLKGPYLHFAFSTRTLKCDIRKVKYFNIIPFRPAEGPASWLKPFGITSKLGMKGYYIRLKNESMV